MGVFPPDLPAAPRPLVLRGPESGAMVAGVSVGAPFLRATGS